MTEFQKSKVGIRAHDFGCMKPIELATVLADAGIETVQLALPKAILGVESVYDVNSTILTQVKDAFNEKNVEIGVLGCYMEIGLSDKQARLEEVEKFKIGITHAAELNAGLIGTETSGFPIDGENREPAYQNLKDSVLRMVEHAEKHDVTIAIEPVAFHVLNSAKLARRLLDEVASKKLKIIFDPVNLIHTQADIEIQESIYHNVFELIGSDIAALHVKDIVFEGDEKVWRNLGKGDINLSSVFNWLQKNSTAIPLLREEINPNSAQSDLNAIRQLMK
ncbi:MAG: sugar phosphate isomerase/epimerase [Oscillospiraceae bacterium]|nr:sugar phosphate isomerase/epimerase [Oscillospiraceae bacterium]